MKQEALTGPWTDDRGCFNLQSVAKHRDQLEPGAIIEKLRHANRSLNNFLEKWGKKKIGQGHDLYVYHIPAAQLTPSTRALFLHIYLDVLHTSVLVGESEPEVFFKKEDTQIIKILLQELVTHSLIILQDNQPMLHVKDFMVGGELLMIRMTFLDNANPK